MRLKTRPELPLPVLLSFAGIPEREWQERRGEKTKHHHNIPRSYYLTPEESAVIAGYCRAQCGEHPEKGCRTRCGEMVD